MSKISLIIATKYSKDRQLQLKKIITESELQLAGLDYEIIIVNNGNFNPDVNSLIGLCKKSRVRILFQKEAGLSLARNYGIKESTGEYLYFLDDDVEVKKNYFLNLYLVFKNNPNCLCVGGSVTVLERTELGKFADNFYYRFLSPPKFPEFLSNIQKPYYIAGASMAFKKVAFEKYGLFNERLGRKKDTLLSNEDSEMIMRIPQKNTFLEPKSQIFVHVNTKRLSNKYFIRRFFWQGVSDGIMFSNNHMKGRYYDNQELSFRKGLSYILISELLNFDFNKFVCSLSRYFGFKLYKLYI